MLRAIECALNRDLLLECEKSILYFAFDTKEMLKGDIQSRYAAYKTALDSSFLQPDEVRYMEDLPPLGLNVIKLGLNTVLFDPATRTVYTKRLCFLEKETLSQTRTKRRPSAKR